MITIISGTNRPNSNSRVIAEWYLKLLADREMPGQILDLADLPADFIFSALYENSGSNRAFNETAALIRESDKFVFVVPEYNNSFPGVLKGFIDGLAYPSGFRHKKAALVGLSSGSQGGILALSHLTDILNYLGMHVFARKIRLPYIEKNLDQNSIANEEYKRLMQDQVDLFLAF